MGAIVIGTTTEQEVQIASRSAPFELNALVQIDTGPDAGIGQITAVYSFNRFLPEARSGIGPVDPAALDALRQLGWDTEGETVHIATVRLLESRTRPVRVGASVHAPDFKAIAPYYLPKEPDKAFALGVIRGTESVAEQVPMAMRERVPVWTRGMSAPIPGPGIPLFFDYFTQQDYPHIGIFGGSGSGKSFALRVLVEEMMKFRLPGIILDPHSEMEFSRPFPNGGKYARTFKEAHRVGIVCKDISIDFTKLDLPLLMQLLEVALDTFSESMKQVVRAVWRKNQDLATFQERLQVAMWAHEGMPDPSQDAKTARMVKTHGDLVALGKNIGAAESIMAVSRRLTTLQMQGIFGQGRDAVEWAKEAIMSRQMAVLRGSMRELQLVGLYVIRSLYDQRTAYRDAVERDGRAGGEEKIYPFWVIADEAHNFAPKNPEQWAPTRSILIKIAQEGRKYGVFEVLATQRPALLNETITAQLTTKLLMRTVRAQDIETLKNETDITAEEARRLPYLKSGEGFLSLGSEGKTVPVRIRVPHTTGREQRLVWDELDEHGGKYAADEPESEIVSAIRSWLEKYFHIRTVDMGRLVQSVSTQTGRSVSLSEVKATLEMMVARGELVCEGIVNRIYRRPDESLQNRMLPDGSGEVPF